jgi:probable F420-dependent oxidoreductase
VPLQMIGISLTGGFPQGMPAMPALVDNARRIERLGFDAIWSGDHIMNRHPRLDAVTLLTTYAAVTERVNIGTAVYLMPLRHPVATAKQVATLDLLSQGRFIFGVGVGGEIPAEFEAVNVPVRERGGRTDEGLDILTRVLSQEHVTYEGRYYQLRDVTLLPRSPQQPHPPIWIGGRSEAALRRTARFAQGWMGYLVSRQRLRQALQQVQELAPTYGRDPGDVQGGMLLFTSIAKDYETGKQMAITGLSSRYYQPFDHLVERYCVFGTPEQCLETITRFVEAGMSNLVFSFTCPPEQTTDHIEQCAADILPHLRS